MCHVYSSVIKKVTMQLLRSLVHKDPVFRAICQQK